MDFQDPNKEIPFEIDGMKKNVRNLCNQPLCIEPAHLEIGTASQNHFEHEIANGTINRGDNHHAHKISAKLAAGMKLSKLQRGEDGCQCQRLGAQRFGVPKHIVRDIDFRGTWASIPDREGIRNARVQGTRKICSGEKKRK